MGVTDVAGDDSFALTFRYLPGQVVVSVEGELDLLTAPALLSALESLVEQHPAVVLDLGGLGFIDASGLGVLARAAHALPPGQVLSIRAPSAGVRRLLAIAGLPALVVLEHPCARPSCAVGALDQEPGLFAGQASTFLSGSGRQEEVAAQWLWDALRLREVIAQAQGVVMAREGVSAEVAYGVLRQSSKRAGVPVRRHAAAVVDSTRRDDQLGPVPA